DEEPRNLSKAYELARRFENIEKTDAMRESETEMDEAVLQINAIGEAQNGKSSCDRVAAQIILEGGFFLSKDNATADEASLKKGEEPRLCWTAYLTKKGKADEEPDDTDSIVLTLCKKKKEKKSKTVRPKKAVINEYADDDSENDWSDVSDEDEENIDDFGREQDDVIHDIILEEYRDLFD
ncbi:hypothetical protein PMAYCL1PPCAC_15991, partial [Pristionchus mayeri]